jgi:hypothetical protein
VPLPYNAPTRTLSHATQWSFLDQLSQIPDNIVIGVVRNKAATDKRVAEELNRPNIHILQADITSYTDLKVGLCCDIGLGC